ncbi:ABC transporter ATP-binding protein [Cruoricaptor ignavus]|uniref:ABC transporter ATP-binding protein n=1 Tax=Cruoricaptor ignavus TaxID=1118202 RepID=UPI00370D4C81
MSEEILIKAEHVSKKFCKDLNLGLWYGLQDLGASVFGSDQPRELRKKEFWAVDDISFEVKRGECLGLLGHNGAGKSTLLKVLTGLIAPDRGRVEMHGRVNALIELTAGFNPILTGRENIFNNGAVLGLTEKEIRAKFDEIVAFSELEEFIDTPVQYYSSGMKVRLGFSVAAHTEPDVLILDEVLAVGDAGFQIKSYNKMKEVMKNSAVIFVSHSMPQITRTCSQVLFLRQGKSYYEGYEVHKGIELYLDEFESNQGKIESTIGAEIESFSVNSLEISDISKPVIVKYGQDLVLDLVVNITKVDVEEFYIIVRITDKDLRILGSVYTNKFHPNFINKNKNNIRVIIKELNLIDGEYTISYIVAKNNKDSKTINNFLCIYRDYIKIKSSGIEMADYAPIFFKSDIIQY